MMTKHVGILVTTLLLLSSTMLLATVKAVPLPNLPLTQVQLTVVDGSAAYFVSRLSGVPGGFDVRNRFYAGWCVDRSVTMTRAVAHNVMLYSSISPPVLTDINWVAINYILNHKEGTMMDVQQAIWHFTDAFSPISATAQAMVDTADANPSYDPTTGALLAVIVVPQDDPHAQNIIIELGVGTVSYDLNHDGVVDIKDIAIAASAFGTYAGQLGFNPEADFNGDGQIDVRDLVIVIQHFGAVV